MVNNVKIYFDAKTFIITRQSNFETKKKFLKIVKAMSLNCQYTVNEKAHFTLCLEIKSNVSFIMLKSELRDFENNLQLHSFLW